VHSVVTQIPSLLFVESGFGQQRIPAGQQRERFGRLSVSTEPKRLSLVLEDLEAISLPNGDPFAPNVASKLAHDLIDDLHFPLGIDASRKVRSLLHDASRRSDGQRGRWDRAGDQ
jgi:hypothetical protein